MIKVILFSALFAFSAYAQWESPNEKTEGCVSSPAELILSAEVQPLISTLTDVNQNQGLAALQGQWKYSSLFAKATISFRFDDTGFYVQSDDDVPEKVSLCPAPKNWIRVSVHEPGCPENKNIYIQATAGGRITLKAYSTRVIGSVKFKKISDQPADAGSPKPKPQCAGEKK